LNDLAVEPGTERAHFLRPRGRAGLEALHATFVRHRYALHTHETFTIALVERGAASFDLDGFRHVAPAGSTFVIPPNGPHTGESATPGGYTYKVLYIDPEEAAAELDAPAGRHPSKAEVVIKAPQIAARLARLHRLLAQNATGLEYGESLSVSLASLRPLLTTHPASETRRNRNAAVRRARAYLEDHFAERVSLEELAREARLSTYHLARTFRTEVGIPPSTYQRQLRIRRAMQELRAGVPAARVAADCGFADQAHLTRQFKRVVGVPPATFASAG
jgi:AraC-like DNA-binding protein